MANRKGIKTVTGLVTEEEMRQIDARAQAEGRSRADVVVRALRFYVEHAPIVRADDIPRPKPKVRR